MTAAPPKQEGASPSDPPRELIPSVAPTRIELRGGSAPKAPPVPRELRGAAPPPPPGSGSRSVPEPDGLVDLVQIDIDDADLLDEITQADPAQGDAAQGDSSPVAPRPPSARPKQLPAICAFGRYELIGRVAFGGMAEIFLAREYAAEASRYLVIKRILPHVANDQAFVEMFLDEARLAMHLNHPNICHIYEFGEMDGAYFIAMEWINGVPLGKLIRRARQDEGIPPELAAKVIAQVAEALHYAHIAKDQSGRPLNIVHRDVSPHNIMVSYEGVVKLLDFGIAKAVTQGAQTQAGVIKGKFAYMSPQQCSGLPIDGRADIFALGVCMFETLTGRPLYHRKTEYETMRAVIDGEVPSIRKLDPELPEGLDVIVQRCLQKEPDDRYATARDLQYAIEEWLAESRRFVNSAKIAEFMEANYEDEMKRGPLVDSTPFGQSLNLKPRKIPSKQPPPAGEAAPAAAEAKPAKRTGLIALLVAALVAFVALAAFHFGRAPERQVVIAAPVVPAVSVPESAADPGPVPDPEPPPPPQTGAASFRSRPAGATVFVDDLQIEGVTPLRGEDLSPGDHAIRLVLEGHEPWEGTLLIEAGVRSQLVATLQALPEERGPRQPATPPGRLSINTRPWSKVYLGHRLLGTTPIGEARVPSGAVRLRLVDRDGNTHRKTVRVRPGQVARVFFDLNR